MNWCGFSVEWLCWTDECSQSLCFLTKSRKRGNGAVLNFNFVHFWAFWEFFNFIYVKTLSLINLNFLDLLGAKWASPTDYTFDNSSLDILGLQCCRIHTVQLPYIIYIYRNVYKTFYYKSCNRRYIHIANVHLTEIWGSWFSLPNSEQVVFLQINKSKIFRPVIYRQAVQLARLSGYWIAAAISVHQTKIFLYIYIYIYNSEDSNDVYSSLLL